MISTRENLKVELQQNLAYHEHRQQEEDALAELQQKQRELGGAAGADDIQAQVDDLNRKIEKARIEEAKTKGALEQVTSNVKQCQEELKERKYKTAEDVHRERLLDYKANSMAAADLDQYYKALDRALVRFHQKKMEDINKSIRELWTKTYKGEVTAAAAAAAASTPTAISSSPPTHHLLRTSTTSRSSPSTRARTARGGGSSRTAS